MSVPLRDRLGPLRERDFRLLVVVFGAGSVVGGLVALRIRPSRPLLASVLAPSPFVFQLLALSFPAPVWVLSVVAFAGGVGLSIHLALWFTVFQREVPEHAQSRVSSYDALGSFVLIPVSMAVVGPIAAAAGFQRTLLGAAAINAVCLAVIAMLPSVRAIRAPSVTTMAAE